MPFDDNDLKRLKDEANRTDLGNHYRSFDMPMATFLAILARLEAAEKVVLMAKAKREAGDMLGGTDDIYDAEEAWRKVCGK